ncbi:MAG: ribosomal protein L13e [Theionarchaea archaeon]|nr:ribosomal protein L13e [Theionarchaea archaeon]
MEPQVKKIHGLKSGRGFSLSEVHHAGFSIRQVRKLGVYIDQRRKTLHEFNVQTLQMLMEERLKELEEEAKRIELEREERKEETEKKKRKEEEKERKKKEKEKKKAEEKEKKEKEKEKKKAEEKEKKEKEKEEEKEKGIDLTEIKGVGKKKAEAFEAAGIYTVEDLLKADTEELAEKTQFTSEYIEKLKEQARLL